MQYHCQRSKSIKKEARRPPFSLLFRREFFFSHTAQRADKVITQIRKLGAGSYPVIGISQCLIITPSTDIAYIFHCSFLLFSYILICPSGVMVTTSRGNGFPLLSIARRTAFSNPPQHGTDMRATVTLRISFCAKIAASFSA